MLRSTEIELWPQGETRLYSASGSVLHGALMECVGRETASALHTESLRPYSQHVRFDKERGCSVWRIGTVSDEAYERIVLPVLDRSELYLKQKQIAVALGKHSLLQENTFAGLADEMFANCKPPKGVRISFLTTTSFKHDRRYDIFPELKRIFYSLIWRWNYYGGPISLEQDGLEDVLAQSCRIVRYELRSQPYPLEHTAVFGFCGSLQLQCTGNDMTRRLIGLLFSLAPYTGIGIKTALGMGAVQTCLQ